MFLSLLRILNYYVATSTQGCLTTAAAPDSNSQTMGYEINYYLRFMPRTDCTNLASFDSFRQLLAEANIGTKYFTHFCNLIFFQ